MEISSPEAMCAFAADVRQQEASFVARATEAFTAVFSAEYRRLRAASLERGEHEAVLNLTVRCNFDPNARSVEFSSAPAPYQAKVRHKAVRVE